MSGEEESSVANEEFEPQGGKKGVIYLIDFRPSMFNKDFMDDNDQECTKFNVALKCCRTVLMNAIIAKRSDLIGVVLFGTDTPDPKTNTKHVTLLVDLNLPSAQAVKYLDDLLKDEDSLELQRTYGSSNDFLIADALWYCCTLFSKSGSTLDEKQIMLLTDDSDPHASHPDRAHMARKRAKDISQINITLEALPMGNDFNYSKSYKELVEIVNGSPEPEALNPSTRLEELLERVNRLEYKARRYSKIKWTLGNGVFLGISLYTMYSEAKMLPKESLNRATNEPVKSIRQTFDQATGELLLPTDVVNVINVAGEDIIFTDEEKDMLRKVMDPGMTLLGFKPESAVKEGLHCGQPAFAYAEETLVEGSKCLMKALVQRCISKKRVAFCCITQRVRALTKYVFLVPSEETYDSEGKQLTPCGFHIIPIPYHSDIREMKFDKSPPIEPETVELAKRLIKKLKFNYKPSNFKNPKLQNFWSYLEALALEYEAPELIEDETIPDLEGQTERLGCLADEFNNACSIGGKPNTAAKRTSTSSESRAKKQSKPETDIKETILAAISSKKVEKCTVVQLKEFLKSYGENVTGKRKEHLVEAVYNLKL